jgi:hypothetical protein
MAASLRDTTLRHWKVGDELNAVLDPDDLHAGVVF